MVESTPSALEERVADLERKLGSTSAKPRRGISRRRIAVLMLIAALAAPAVVLASDRFTDVPNTNTFHSQINVLATAGITRGCNPPTNTLYCPADPVRRDQMAAFIIRSAGRMDQGVFSFPGVADGSPFASLSVKTEGRAWIDVRASFYFFSPNTATSPVFPCENAVEVYVDGLTDITARVWARTNANPASGDWEVVPASAELAIPVDLGTHTVELRWFAGEGNCDMEIGRGTVTAEVIPFDASSAGNPALPTGPSGAGGGADSSGR